MDGLLAGFRIIKISNTFCESVYFYFLLNKMFYIYIKCYRMFFLKLDIIPKNISENIYRILTKEKLIFLNFN